MAQLQIEYSSLFSNTTSHTFNISSSLLSWNPERIGKFENIAQSCITFGLKSDYSILENLVPKIPDNQLVLKIIHFHIRL
jgi:hypothetical protein